MIAALVPRQTRTLTSPIIVWSGLRGGAPAPTPLGAGNRGRLAAFGQAVLWSGGRAGLGPAPAPAAPLLLTATLKAQLIATPSPPSWTTIDPERSQELPPSYGT